MPRKRKIINKKQNKLAAGKCRICGEDDYALLDNHRIVEGAKGGKYTKYNVVVLCSNCHRRTHDGQIVIDRYYLSTAGTVLRVFIDGEERFV
tara:strand:+ start:281 stop:556 length:276 start_codon:yes stop_codon:yes gene_type:complete